jgi:hypothetical protein
MLLVEVLIYRPQVIFVGGRMTGHSWVLAFVTPFPINVDIHIYAHIIHMYVRPTYL